MYYICILLKECINTGVWTDGVVTNLLDSHLIEASFYRQG